METRHQVFVSSTFTDLEEARREVSSALLKSDCFPSGMELFPAADLEQFEYIKQIISESDYFLIVSAGKYGSIHPETELSYTEMEYDYAVEIGKPIIRLLHQNPFDGLAGKHIEKSDAGKTKLNALREKLTKTRLVTFWNDPKELGQATIFALLDIRKRFPSPGWVRGENALTIEIMRELEKLRSLKDRKTSSKGEDPVNFDKITKSFDVQVLVASSDAQSKQQKCGSTKVVGSQIAEAIFIALVSDTSVSSIASSASDTLTPDAKFSKKQKSFDHCWLELSYDTTKHFLHHLEARGLVRGRQSDIVSNWELTQRGRMHATYLSSQRYLT